jgi:hypothetical protein
MPKLNKEQAKQVANAQEQGGGFLLPEGRYAARLRSVTERMGSEFPYWDWEFEAIHDEEGNPHPGRQWNRTSLSPKSSGFLKASFNAFGFSPDSDTDEIVGEWAVLYLSQEIQAQGLNAGKKRNVVDRVATFDPAEWDFDPDTVAASQGNGSGGGGGKADDEF